MTDAALIAALRREASRLQRAHRRRDELILEAHGRGMSLRRIAEAAGVTNPRVHQLVKGNRS
jgi:hypothetical protein